MGKATGVPGEARIYKLQPADGQILDSFPAPYGNEKGIHALAAAGRRSYKATFACCSIEKASLGNDAGFMGAAAFARDNLARERS